MADSGDDWWRRGVIYQVYPRSFQDTNGDGIGDLEGIRQRLHHLSDLGVDAIWLSPINPSPMKDFGYDISDYCDVDPIFGSLGDLDRLLDEVHAAGMKLLLDFVPSHTSDEHPWFQASRSARNNPKRDWYVWRDARADGRPPNNWLSEFGGPAWTWDEGTGQYYLNIYLPEQPALNWRNAKVRAEMYNVMRFWFDRGVDGFRIDAVEHLAPDDQFRDNLPNPDWQPYMGPARSLFRTYSSHQPAGHSVVREMRGIADSYPGRVLVGEAYGTLDEVMAYYGPELDGFHLPFNFQLLEAKWDAPHIAGLVEAYEARLPPGAWPNWVLGNHDRARIASRVGAAQARVAATMLLTLRGTPTVYQGDELGLPNGEVPPEMVQDPWERNVPGHGLGRDPVRTPMIWEDGPGAGFTGGTPWLPLSEGVPASGQAGDPGSMLSLYRNLLALRRAEPALSLGEYRTLHAEGEVYAFVRSLAGERLAVCLNFGSRTQPMPARGEVLLSTRRDRAPEEAALLPDEGVILRLG